MIDPHAVGTGALTPGSQLGRYQILKRLALGGMAELYLARQLAEAGVEKIVAVKRVLPHLAEDEAFVKMFLNEARVAASLDHGNIVHVLDFGSEVGEHFMAMEYVHGRSVADVLRRGAKTGGVPLGCALSIVRDVAAALHYAHERAGPDGRPMGLVHRDVSPSNVLVTYDGDVKLVDFGIAKATATSQATRTGTIKGKLPYMAPEQLRGDLIDRRADVFSLGVVAYELTTGQRCFYAAGEFALINRVAAARFERPTSLVVDYPAELEAIIVRALSAAPEDRFATARDLQVAIEGFAASAGLVLSQVALSEHLGTTFGIEAYPTTQAVPRPAQTDVRSEVSPTAVSAIRRPLRRRTVWLTGLALAAGVAVGVGAPALLRDGTTEAEAGTSTSNEAAAATGAPATAPSRPELAGASEPRPVAAAPAQGLGAAAEAEAEAEEIAEPPRATPPVDGAAPASKPADTRRSRGSRRKRGRSAGKRGRASKPKTAPPEYLPPSRRD